METKGEVMFGCPNCKSDEIFKMVYRGSHFEVAFVDAWNDQGDPGRVVGEDVEETEVDSDEILESEFLECGVCGERFLKAKEVK